MQSLRSSTETKIYLIMDAFSQEPKKSWYSFLLPTREQQITQLFQERKHLLSKELKKNVLNAIAGYTSDIFANPDMISPLIDNLTQFGLSLIDQKQ